MPLRLDVKKKLNTHTDRVKSVDIHSTEPWVLSALYSGVLMIHNWETQTLVKSIETSQLPIRCAKFIARKQWIVATGDDMSIRVYNYNTMEKVKEFDAHSDYIRYITVHSTLSYLLSASDDMTIKLWDWDRDWMRVQSFEGHAHYVMMCQWNPRDPHIFASASLDRTIKVWGIPSVVGGSIGGITTSPHFVLSGHDRGVNCVEYSPTGERPYIVSGSDDKTVRVWDYQTKQCVVTLTGHTRNVSSVSFHPRLPVIISGAEDGTLRVWHSATFRLETTISYHMDRVWNIATLKTSSAVAVAYDEGTLVIKLGGETPICSMQGGKIIWSKGSEIQTVNLKFVDDALYGDGERLPLPIKDLGSCEIFPQSISHHPNGRFIAVCGDDEYIIHTAQALRSKSYGKALELVWSPEGLYAIRDESKITIFQNFKESTSMRPSFPVEMLFGGQLLGLGSTDCICFYDWHDLRLVRRIEVAPQKVYWNDTGELVCLASVDSFYILRHDKDAVQAAITACVPQTEGGIEIAFDLLHEVNEKIDSGVWVSDCFVFVSLSLRLQMYIAGKIEPLAFLERKFYILGYLPENNRLYLIDADLMVISYVLQLSLVEYMCAVCRKEFDVAAQSFEKLPEELHNKAARFLEHQGQKEAALQISKDEEHRFDLALSLGKLDVCMTIAKAAQQAQKSNNKKSKIHEIRFKRLGDAALEHNNRHLATACFTEAPDAAGLMLIAVSTGDVDLLTKAAKIAATERNLSVAILSHLLIGNLDECLDILVESNRLPEAAFFARTYRPSRVGEIVILWRESLGKLSEQLGKNLADPSTHPNLFPKFDLALQAETIFRERKDKLNIPLACHYAQLHEMLEVDIISELEKSGYDKVRAIFLTEMSSEVVPPSTNMSANTKTLLDDSPRVSGSTSPLTDESHSPRRESALSSSVPLASEDAPNQLIPTSTCSPSRESPDLTNQETTGIRMSVDEVAGIDIRGMPDEDEETFSDSD